MGFAGALRFCSERQLCYGMLPPQSLPAETVEFSVSHASEKSVPFVRGKTEHRPSAIPAVADANLLVW
jgi:hypothetical protein